MIFLDWNLLQESSVLNHKLIKFNIKATNSKFDLNKDFQFNTRQFKTSKTKSKLFDKHFNDHKPKLDKTTYTNEELDQIAREITNAIVKALENSTPKIVKTNL